MSEQDSMDGKLRKPSLKLAVTIVDREHFQRTTDVFSECHIYHNFTCLARGTATSEIMDMLGLGTPEKAMIIGVGNSLSMRLLLSRLSQELQLEKRGRGIAFTIPLSGISSKFLSRLNQIYEEELGIFMEKSVDNIKKTAPYHLILALINQGFSEDVMSAAKKAGATGGTVLNARRGGIEAAEKFYGISIQEKKEIVAILASQENRNSIMQSISNECGLKTDARGMVISMPVDNVEGVQL